MNNKEDIERWLLEHYNHGLEVYILNDKVRLTNGSAAMYVDIFIEDGVFHLVGRRYGETINKTTEPRKDELLDTLSKTI